MGRARAGITIAAALPSGPSVAQVAAVIKDAANVVSSVKSFTDATGSQCN